MKKSSINLLYAFIGILAIAAIVIVILLFSSPTKAFEGFSNGYSMEYFMMESCPHCKTFNKTWEAFRQAVQSSSLPVKLEKFDITGDGETRAQKFKVNSAPTLIVTKNNEMVKEYDGPREVSAMLSFIKSLL
jgi:thiol-disulfide isomerase/thioredoxin